MKLTANTFKDMAKVVLGQKQQRTRLINPTRDWSIGLLVGFLILVAVVSWSGYMYVSNRSIDEKNIDTNPVSVPMYRAATVAEAIEYFAGRQQTFNNIQGSASQVLPPVRETQPTATSTDAVESVVQETETTASSTEPIASSTTSTTE